MIADSSLNSLLNSSALVKCYFVTPNFSGFLKIRLFSRRLLGGERPLEQRSSFRCKKITFPALDVRQSKFEQGVTFET